MTGRSLRLGGGPGGEFDRLRAIFATLGAAGRDLGDDCALLPVGGRTLAISIDLSLEGVHFRTDWLSFREIGWRATAAALSDLAAEGAQPLGLLVSLGIPSNVQRATGKASPAVQIMSGVGAAARNVGAIDTLAGAASASWSRPPWASGSAPEVRGASMEAASRCWM